MKFTPEEEAALEAMRQAPTSAERERIGLALGVTERFFAPPRTVDLAKYPQGKTTLDESDYKAEATDEGEEQTAKVDDVIDEEA